jgi:hypothetical protein
MQGGRAQNSISVFRPKAEADARNAPQTALKGHNAPAVNLSGAFRLSRDC